MSVGGFNCIPRRKNSTMYNVYKTITQMGSKAISCPIFSFINGLGCGIRVVDKKTYD